MAGKPKHDWEAIKADFEVGMNTFDISEKYQINSPTITRKMRNLGIKRPENFVVKKTNYKQKYPWNDIFKELKNGMTRESICKKYSLTPIILSYGICKYSPEFKVKNKAKKKKKEKNINILKVDFNFKKYNCKIMQKIEVSKLLYNRKSIQEISDIMNLSVSDIETIVQSFKKRG